MEPHVDIEAALSYLHRLKEEHEALSYKIEGIEQLLDLWGVPYDTLNSKRGFTQRKSVMNVVLTLLEEVGADGLNAAIALRMASAKGIELNRGSVSSLLSRLKRDDVVDYDGERYRLKVFSGDTDMRSYGDELVAA